MSIRIVIGSVFLCGAMSMPLQGMALDARDWESNAHAMVNIKTNNPKNEQLSVLRLLFCFGEGIFNDYDECINDTDKYYDNDAQSINFKIKNQWHDIIGYQSNYYFKKQHHVYDYSFQFYFKQHTLSVSDVIGRYGLKGLDAHTNSDFSKTLVYFVGGKNRVNANNPISSFAPQDKKREVAIAFHSNDKTYIDKMVVLVRIPDK